MEPSNHPPICHFCNNAILTIKHLHTECHNLENSRLLHLNPLRVWDLKNILGNNADAAKVLSFMKANQIYEMI